MTTDKKDLLDELVEDRTRKSPDFPTKLREAIERRRAADKLRPSKEVA